MDKAEMVLALRRAARRLHAGMPKGGFLGPKKGKAKIYNRRVKHPKGDRGED